MFGLILPFSGASLPPESEIGGALCVVAMAAQCTTQHNFVRVGRLKVQMDLAPASAWLSLVCRNQTQSAGEHADAKDIDGAAVSWQRSLNWPI